MASKICVIMQGPPGSGKSTFVRTLLPEHAIVCSADEFFVRDGEYRFDPSRLKDAHAYCKRVFEEAVELGVLCVVVDNTNLLAEHAKPYIELARQYSYNVVICTATGEYPNTHGVPDHAVQRLKNRMEKIA